VLDGILARPVRDLIPVRDAREPLRALIASLAPGGAERIVLEWLAAEAARGRAIELAVLHARRNALAAPAGISPRVRCGGDPATFVAALACEWRSSRAPVSTHLVGDDLLSLLWREGIRTIPTVHNARGGWRNDPARWDPADVPLVVACADHVRRELIEAGCRAPIVTLRHRPCVGAAAFDASARERVRAELGIASGTFLVGAIGALKPQKDYRRAIEVLARLRRHRDAALVILGGILDAAGLEELDRVVALAVERGVADRLRLPGFVPVIEPYFAACDALLNVSRFEGLSMAVQEALAAGLPVVATDVEGQREISHRALERVPRDAASEEIARRLGAHAVRRELAGRPWTRAPRAGSLALSWRERRSRSIGTLFVTANLNAGGAQRSLVNLVRAIARRHALEVAVCSESTHDAFARMLQRDGIDPFRPAADADPVAVAESLLARIHRQGAANACFWNADPKVKLALAKFAPASLRLVDVSPGHYAFDEMDAASEFAEALAYSPRAYYERLDLLVLKYRAASHPACARVAVIPNGVHPGPATSGAPPHPRFLVSGRIAPSKRLSTVIEAFAALQPGHPDAELHLVGPVEERHAAYASRLREEAAGLRVFFRGASFGFDHLEEAFSAAIVLGTHQGCPNAVLEAMAAGIPVVANDSGGTRELIPGERYGWLLPEAATAGELALALREVIDRPEDSRSRARAARERVRTEFTIEAMAERYLAILGAADTSAREKMEACSFASVPAAQPS